MINKNNGLMLFIKGFPQTLTPDELQLFLHRVIADAKRDGDCGNGSVSDCTVVRTTSAGIQGVERYALVELKPARFALCCIKELHGRELMGVTIVARRYRQRSPLCERRYFGQKQGNIGERRIIDRRREGVRIEAVDCATPRILVTLIRAFRSQPLIGVYAK